jgi:hypothetical protein
MAVGYPESGAGGICLPSSGDALRLWGERRLGRCLHYSEGYWPHRTYGAPVPNRPWRPIYPRGWSNTGMLDLIAHISSYSLPIGCYRRRKQISVR